MADRKNSLIPLKILCDKTLKKIPGGKRIKEGLALYYWPKVIGEKLAEKTEAVKISNGRLWVKTPDPTLTQNLFFFNKQIIKKYAELLGSGTVRSVRIITGAITHHQGGERNNHRGEPRVVSAEKIQLPSEIEIIEDEELRAAFARFFQSHALMKER